MSKLPFVRRWEKEHFKYCEYWLIIRLFGVYVRFHLCIMLLEVCSICSLHLARDKSFVVKKRYFFCLVDWDTSCDYPRFFIIVFDNALVSTSKNILSLFKGSKWQSHVRIHIANIFSRRKSNIPILKNLIIVFRRRDRLDSDIRYVTFYKKSRGSYLRVLFTEWSSMRNLRLRG